MEVWHADWCDEQRLAGVCEVAMPVTFSELQAAAETVAAFGEYVERPTALDDLGAVAE
jgi:hypothetical protein